MSRSPCRAAQTKIFTQTISQMQTKAEECLKKRYLRWLLLRCWPQTSVCNRDVRYQCSSGPWNRSEESHTWRTTDRYNSKTRAWRGKAKLTRCSAGEHRSPFWQLLQWGSGVRWKCGRCVQRSAPPTLTQRFAWSKGKWARIPTLFIGLYKCLEFMDYLEGGGSLLLHL